MVFVKVPHDVSNAECRIWLLARIVISNLERRRLKSLILSVSHPPQQSIKNQLQFCSHLLKGCSASPRTITVHPVQGFFGQFAFQAIPPTLPLPTSPFAQTFPLLSLLLFNLIQQLLSTLLQLCQSLSRCWIGRTWQSLATLFNRRHRCQVIIREALGTRVSCGR